jgi:hypothetical protein
MATKYEDAINFVKTRMKNEPRIRRSELHASVRAFLPDVRPEDIERDVLWVAQNALLEEGIDIACHRGEFYHASTTQTVQRAGRTWTAARRKATRSCARYTLAAASTTDLKVRERLDRTAGHRASLLQSLHAKRNLVNKIDVLLRVNVPQNIRVSAIPAAEEAVAEESAGITTEEKLVLRLKA